MKETQLDGQSTDIAEENIQKLKALFPEIVTEGKVGKWKLFGIFKPNIYHCIYGDESLYENL